MRLLRDINPINVWASIVQRTAWWWLRRSPAKRGVNAREIQRKSDTLTILGCGQSINELSDADWAEIRAGDTLAMNFWVLHGMAPDFYLLEGFVSQDECDFFQAQLQASQSDFSNTIWLMQTREFLRYVKRPKLFMQRLRNINGARWFWLRYQKTDLKHTRLEPTPRRQAGSGANLLKGSGSATLALAWAFAMGYQRVIFAGVDLDARGYFWNTPGHPHERFREQAAAPGAPAHRSSLGRRFAPTQDFVEHFSEHWAKPAGVEVLVAKPSGRLAEFLPCAFGEDEG